MRVTGNFTEQGVRGIWCLLCDFILCEDWQPFSLSSCILRFISHTRLYSPRFQSGVAFHLFALFSYPKGLIHRYSRPRNLFSACRLFVFHSLTIFTTTPAHLLIPCP